MFAFIAATTALTMAAPASDISAVSWGKERMKNSSTGPDNTLPSFLFMAGGEEGGSLFGGAFNYLDGGGGTGKPSPFMVPVDCPDDLFENMSPDLRVPQLPWALQDDWGCERTPMDVDVVVAENDFLRAAITPQWGGKVWSLYHKKYKRQLFFNNPAHQPNNIGYRKAWTSGGCEWNWAPGKIGHSVFTESPVYTATLNTSKGPVVCVWEYDRLNHTVWQVDVLVLGETMWAHPKITNADPLRDLPGYWWTCVAMPVDERTRIVTPAELSVTPCAAWPNGAWMQRNVSFRGPDLDGCSADDNGRGTCAWQQDMSYLGNIPNSHDFFFRIQKPQRPYITHVSDDGYSVIHSHPLNGTKFFEWGMAEYGTFQQDFMSASDYQNPNCTNPWYDPWCSAYEHEGRYTELQIGPAPTQMHTFPLPRNSTYEWTEWFQGWSANVSRMHARDYNTPLAEVADWMETNMPQKEVDDMDAFLSPSPTLLRQISSTRACLGAGCGSG